MTRACVDPIAVERAVLGDRVRLTPRERRAAVHELTRRGECARVIAERLQVTARTVVRCRGREEVAVSAFGAWHNPYTLPTVDSGRPGQRCAPTMTTRPAVG